jgi:hypothetical protein
MTPEIKFVFLLLVVFQIKHFLGDYLFQTNWMVVGKGKPGIGFVVPLGVHVGIHAIFTAIIVYIVNPALWYLAVFDFVVHFTMDRIKSGPRYLGRFNDPSKHIFWICLGFDQMVHHVTHYAIIWWLLLHQPF